jgi:hypothetical protein
MLNIYYKLIDDEEIINYIFHLPNNEKWLYDDTWQALSTTLPYLPHNYYLACYLNDEIVGLVLGYPSESNKELHLHLAFIPKVYGKCEEICQGVIKWYLNNTPFDILVCSVASNNSLARKIVKACNFSFYKHEKEGWLKNGIEYGKDFFIFAR